MASQSYADYVEGYPDSSVPETDSEDTPEDISPPSRTQEAGD